MKQIGRLLIETLLGLWALGSVPLFAQTSFVYTNDNIADANTVSGFSVGPSGSLTLIPESPFSTGGSGYAGFYATPRIVASPIGGFIYAANGASNNVSVFSINPSSGSLTPVQGSPFATASTGSGDLALAVTPDNKFLFAGDSLAEAITVFSVGTDGTLSIVAGSPYAVPAAGGPIDAMNVSPDGKFLALTQPGGEEVLEVLAEDPVNEIAMYTIGTDGTLTTVSGSPFSAGSYPGGLQFSCPASTLFVSDFNDFNNNLETSVEVDNVAPLTGVLSPVAGSPFIFNNGGFNSDMGILSPNGLNFYVSNQSSGEITGLTVAANGGLTPVAGSPFATGFAGGCIEAPCPTGMAINQAGTLLFSASDSSEVAVLTVANDGTLVPVMNSPFTSGLRTSNANSIAIWPATVCPVVNLSQTSLTFGNQGLKTTSGPQSVTFANASPNAGLTITSITATGDFTQTNTCGTTLSAGDNCTINVTFTPTALGNLTGSITLTENAIGSPQTVALTGTGVQDTTTGVNPSANPSVFGQAVTFTATVSPPPNPNPVGVVRPGRAIVTPLQASGTPTGTVTFNDGTTAICTQVALSSGTALCTTSTLAAGLHSISAVYGGDTNFFGSTSPPVSQTVSAATTSTKISGIAPNPSIVGEPVTVSYMVTVSAPGAGTIPGTDTVTVTDSSGASCTGTISAGSCALVPMVVGPDTLTATYSGDSNLSTSKSPPSMSFSTVPTLKLTGLPSTSPPATATSVGVTLNTPTPTPLTGTLMLTFQPSPSNTAGIPPNYIDPMTKFKTSGSITLNFTIPAGAVQPSQFDGTFSVGTTAGTITVTVSSVMAGNTPVVLTQPIASPVTVPSAAPVIIPGSFTFVPTSTGFNVELMAYSTPLDLNQAPSGANATFTFQANGAQLNGADQLVQLNSAASNWFSNASNVSQNGGSFTLTVPFTFNESITAIESVTVTLSNSVGTSLPVTGTPP